MSDGPEYTLPLPHPNGPKVPRIRVAAITLTDGWIFQQRWPIVRNAEIPNAANGSPSRHGLCRSAFHRADRRPQPRLTDAAPSPAAPP